MSDERHRLFKDRLYGEYARLGRALAHPKRLEIVDLLAQGERAVDALAEQVEAPVANVSQHLQILKRAQLVTSRRDGVRHWYGLSDARVVTLWRALRELGENRLAEIDKVVEAFLGDRDAFDPVDLPELHDRLRRGDVVVLDVRPRLEYEAGHVPGARSVPVEDLEAALPELPEGVEVVAYCRGPYCVFSDEAVQFLRDRGIPARRLREGLPDWRAAGLPVETGE